jgi:hypothetical protein
MSIPAKFDFFEEVRVRNAEPPQEHLIGYVGVVLGRTATDDESTWYYGVTIPVDSQTVSCFFESQLESTGRKYRREDFYDGTSVRVRVDEHGAGSIVRPGE